MKLSDYLYPNGPDEKPLMTDAAFGELVGISQPQVNRLRRGLSRPSWDAIERIDKATGGQVTASDWRELASEKAA